MEMSQVHIKRAFLGCVELVCVYSYNNNWLILCYSLFNFFKIFFYFLQYILTNYVNSNTLHDSTGDKSNVNDTSGVSVYICNS